MKKFLFSALACAMLLPAVTVQAGGRITWKGEKAGILRPCKGAPVGICKEVVINDGGDGRLDDLVDPPGGFEPVYPIDPPDDWDWGDTVFHPSSCNDDTQVTVVFDGMYYECPASWVNWEDGSITPR